MKSSKVGRGMGIFLIITGIGHFLFPKGLDAIVPGFLPGDPRNWTYLSGLAEIAIGISLLLPLSLKLGATSIRLLAAYAALALFIAVYPANINMAIDWSSRPMPDPLFAYARLPLQFGLFYWAWSIIKALPKVN
jgi:uncharacterized membrane protein